MELPKDYICEGQMSIWDCMTDATPLKFDPNKILRVIELFAGYGSQSMALKRLGIKMEHHKVVEFNKYAVNSFNAVHGTDFPTIDIKDITGKDLEIVEKTKYQYLMTYSFPCFTENTLVTTEDGLKKITDVGIGDKVLTHNNRWMPVTDSKMTGHKEIWSIRCMGAESIECTENHMFYVRKMYRKYPRYSDGRRGHERHFMEPEWIECRDITKDYYLGIAIPTEQEVFEWNGIDFEWSDGRKTRHKNELSRLMDSQDFWWIIGRYIGDGWCRSQGGIIICCEKTETEEITERLAKCNLNYSVVSERTVNKLHIPIKEIVFRRW